MEETEEDIGEAGIGLDPKIGEWKSAALTEYTRAFARSFFTKSMARLLKVLSSRAHPTRHIYLSRITSALED